MRWLCAAVVLCTCSATAIYRFSVFQQVLTVPLAALQLCYRRLLYTAQYHFYCGQEVCATGLGTALDQRRSVEHYLIILPFHFKMVRLCIGLIVLFMRTLCHVDFTNLPCGCDCTVAVLCEIDR